jgi:poly(3-hydroxybutyrate) depolymerase
MFYRLGQECGRKVTPSAGISLFRINPNPKIQLMKSSACICRRLFMFALLLSIGVSCVSQQVAKGLVAQNGTHIGFYEYTPTDYNSNPTVKYPLIIFLHGTGERGNGTTDLPRVKGVAIPKYINRGHKMRFFWNGKWETFLVLSPQLSTAFTKWPAYYVDEMIKYAEKNLRIDKDRIFLTGMSMGGGGVWNYASISPDNARKLAAIAPVCGICAMNNAYNISGANLPVWASHAINDPRVSVNCTLKAVESINATKPNVAPILTIYDDGGHTIWDRSMDTGYAWHEPNLYEWFLGQNRKLPPNHLPVANAGDDKEITTGTGFITLNGSASYDTDGSIVKFIWKQIAGPTTVKISNRLLPTSSAGGFLVPGTYKIELTVVDNRTGWQKDTLTVNVSGGPAVNIRPVANAGNDLSIMLPTTSTLIDGSKSFDSDGSITSYSWSKISGPTGGTPLTPKSSKTNISGLQQGVYKYMLEVTDNLGATGRDTIIVTVNPEPAPKNESPTAIAGRDIIITLPQTSIILNGNKSFDPDGTIAAYSWSKIDGPAGETIVSSQSSKTNVTGLKEGKYFFLLTVKDDKGATGRDTVVITVKNIPEPLNQLPTAIAGKDIVIVLPLSSVELDGNESFDIDGTLVSYSWSKIAGPSGGTILTSESSQTTIDDLKEGKYRYELEVKDDKGASDRDTVVVIVKPAPNQPPVARAGKDIIITLPENSVVLDGNESFDADGTIDSFLWTKIGGPPGSKLETAENAVSQLTLVVAGTYRYQLKVTDNKGASSYDTINIRVKATPVPGNIEPEAKAGNDIVITLPLNAVQLDATASRDPDGLISDYLWTMISGDENGLPLAPDQPVSEVENLTAGTYTYMLEVTDNGGAKSYDTVLVTVLPAPNQKPVAQAGNDITIRLPVNSVLLDGSLSTDPDGIIEKFYWTKLEGPKEALIMNAGTATTTIVGLQEGEYRFRLTVTDDAGETNFDDVTISVVAPQNAAPIANAGIDKTITLPFDSTTLDGSASSDDGSIVSYSWTDISKTISATIVDKDKAVTAVKQLSVGDHLFELTVSDNYGIKSRDTVTITVLENRISAQQVFLAPNPARNMIRISYSGEFSGALKINIYDGNGRLMKVYQGVKNGPVYTETLDLHQFSAGLYILELVPEKEKRSFKKFLKL